MAQFCFFFPSTVPLHIRNVWSSPNQRSFIYAACTIAWATDDPRIISCDIWHTTPLIIIDTGTCYQIKPWHQIACIKFALLFRIMNRLRHIMYAKRIIYGFFLLLTHSFYIADHSAWFRLQMQTKEFHIFHHKSYGFDSNNTDKAWYHAV